MVLTQLQNERLQSSRTTAPTEDDDEDEVERLPHCRHSSYCRQVCNCHLRRSQRRQRWRRRLRATTMTTPTSHGSLEASCRLLRRENLHQRAPPQRPQTPEAVTEEDDEDEVLPVELRLVGSLAPGGTARLQIFGGSAVRAGKSLTRDADGVEWFRVRHSGSKQRIANVTGWRVPMHV